MHFVNKNKHNNEENNINIINKISDINSYNDEINQNKIKIINNKNNIDKEEEKFEKLDEYTFRPKTIKLNINSVFKRPKSIDNERYNNQFIWRYNKARENYMIKKIKKISAKDECYKTMLISFNDLINKFKMNNYYYDYNQSSNYHKIIDFDNKRNIKTIRNVVDDLRKELLEIDLNED